MKKSRKTAVAAVLCAVTVLMTGVSAVSAADAASAETESTQIIIDSPLGEAGQPMQTQAQTSAALKPGETLAINLIDAKKDGETYAGGYQLIQVNEEEQGKLFVNGASKIVVSANNNRQDMMALDIWADNACARIRIKNITSACDTIFSEPQKTTICGYDAVMYDYDILQYRFLEDNVTKEHIDTFKGRNYYFYTDKNAYVLMFDTNDETWDEQVKCFEEFVDALVVEGKSNKGGISASAIVLIILAAVIVAGTAGVFLVKKKKKSE